jgi:hypothetical protein
MNHTTGHWKITRQSSNCAYIGTDEGRLIAVFGGYGTKQSQRDAKRVVDLVNALNGVEIKEIRKFAGLYRLRRARKAAALGAGRGVAPRTSCL